jgi:hypothetical protein
MNIHYTENPTHIIGISNNFYEPTFTIFDNAIVVGHKKTGTRFFAHMASYPIEHWKNNHQYDMCMLRIDGSNNNSDDRCYLETLFGKYYVSINFGEGHDDTCPNYDLFFEKNGVKNITEFIFNNEKDIYLIIRNPSNRFLSGIIQVLGIYIDEMLGVESEQLRLKRHIDITDDEIKNVKTHFNEVFNVHHPKQNSKLNKEAVSKIISYILQHYPHLYLQDIHTQNYLAGVKELLYNIKDKSKVKILDLDDCRKKQAFQIFNKWTNSQNYMEIYDNLNEYVLSNRIIYDYIFKYGENDNNILSVRNYLNVEYAHYESLKNSEFFVKL